MSNFNLKSNSIDVRMEKANAILRYRRLQKITNLFRFVEMFVFLFVISRFSSQLPFAFKFSADYFRGISFAVFGPKFVFLIGNVIVLILFFKSRVVCNGKVDFYDEYVKSCEKIVVNDSRTESIGSAAGTSERKICRSQSENLTRVKCEENQSRRKLRRSVTEIRRSKNFDSGGGETAVEEKSCAADELSSDEFRRTVEEFIARQQKSLRDEKYSPIVYLRA